MAPVGDPPLDAGDAGHAEVDEHRPLQGPVGEEDVARLEIAVDHARAVHRPEGPGEAQPQGHRLLDAGAAALQPGLEGLPVQPLHGEVGLPLPRLPVGHVAHHAGVAQRREQADLAGEAPPGGGALVVEHLERDRVAGEAVVGLVHAAHATGPGEVEDVEAGVEELGIRHRGG